MATAYQYAVAEVVRVVDGDTVDLSLDLGFDLRMTSRFRLYGPDPAGDMGINAPELNTPAGKAARTYLSALLVNAIGAGGLTAFTIKDKKEKYGRYLAVLVINPARPDGGINVNRTMVDAGHAVLRKY